jgi:prepilin-type N-terminal cleavage/methylation domain-containing protein
MLSFLRYTDRMRASNHPIKAPSRRSGFSLVELSVVVAIISVVAVLGLETAANFIDRTNGSISKERVATADEAIARFFRIYGRLPCPAARTGIPSASSSNTFGLEDCTITAWSDDAQYGIIVPAAPRSGDGLMAGMVPFRTLGLPMQAAIDGFGGKINYVVTKNLTQAGGTVAAAPVNNRFGSYDSDTGQHTTDGIGGIEIRSGRLHVACSANCQKLAAPPTTGAAYIVFSNGRDQRGAVPLRSNAVGVPCVAAALTSTQGVRPDAMNCQWGLDTPVLDAAFLDIPKNVFYDNRLNAGRNNVLYFDDYVAWRTKGQL